MTTPSSDEAALPEDLGWETHTQLQRRAVLESSPAQRLAWLEAAIAFAYGAGARRPDDAAAHDESP